MTRLARLAPRLRQVEREALSPASALITEAMEP